MDGGPEKIRQFETGGVRKSSPITGMIGPCNGVRVSEMNRARKA